MPSARALTRTQERLSVSDILPPFEGETIQVTIRVPKMVLEKIDDIAKESGHPRATVMVHFLRWATKEWEAERAQQKGGRR